MEHEFIDYQNWNNHLPVLAKSFELLEQTKKHLTVVEYGMGDGSTRQLSVYCKKKGHTLFSYDSSAEWVNAFRSLEAKHHKLKVSNSWEDTTVSVQKMKPDIVLIDHAPGERRCVDVALLKDHAQIIVVHDSEPYSRGYMMYPLLETFTYLFHFMSPEYKQGKQEGAWATAVSMFHPLNFNL